MYDVVAYGCMVADQGRTSAYARALDACVEPGSTVLDIGTGPGIMTLLACRAGAAKVYAVEPGDVLELAREVVQANGYADRVQFIQAMTVDIELPERVDVIVSDIHGVLPLYGGSLVSILDARDRFLKPAGWIIPARETLWAALSSSPALSDLFFDAWDNEYRFDFTNARKRGVNQWRRKNVKACDLVVTPACWTTLDYKNLDSPNIDGEVCWTIDRPAAAHGISVWFETETARGITFSNSPASGEEHVFGQAFFPWPEATQLSVGDVVRVHFRADSVSDDYVWRWDSQLTDGATGRVKTQYRQSSFAAIPVAADRLRKRAHTFVPELNDDARIDQNILKLMDDGLQLADIATRLLAEHPSHFKNWHDALTRAGDLSERYCR